MKEEHADRAKYLGMIIGQDIFWLLQTNSELYSKVKITVVV